MINQKMKLKLLTNRLKLRAANLIYLADLIGLEGEELLDFYTLVAFDDYNEFTYDPKTIVEDFYYEVRVDVVREYAESKYRDNILETVRMIDKYDLPIRYKQIDNILTLFLPKALKLALMITSQDGCYIEVDSTFVKAVVYYGFKLKYNVGYLTRNSIHKINLNFDDIESTLKEYSNDLDLSQYSFELVTVGTGNPNLYRNLYDEFTLTTSDSEYFKTLVNNQQVTQNMIDSAFVKATDFGESEIGGVCHDNMQTFYMRFISQQSS